jgi:hypothetical protein
MSEFKLGDIHSVIGAAISATIQKGIVDAQASGDLVRLKYGQIMTESMTTKEGVATKEVLRGQSVFPGAVTPPA